ncbi:MAG: RNA polymerase sigma factor [Anaerolineae bacterium]
MDGQPTEAELLQQAQAGDMEAFAELQTRLDGSIRRFVWRLIGTHPEEDDVVQDSMIALYLNLERIQPVDKLRPYLFRIVRNRCYDLLRKRRRYEYLSLDDEPVEMWASLHEGLADGQPEEVTHWLMMRLEVETAMNKLPEQQRQTLILYAEEGLAYHEIAEAMDTSIGTVKSRLFYAKKTLRQLVSAETLAWLDAELNSSSAVESHSQTETKQELGNGEPVL